MRRLPLGTRGLIALVVAFLVPAWTGAQTSITAADIRGVIVDGTGGILPGATVMVTQTDTNITRSVTTDTLGTYHVAALPPGTYHVSAALDGFATKTNDLRLVLGQVVTLDFTLELPARRETVTVTETAPLVDPTRTSVSSVIERGEIEGLPINGRNFISFAALTPGVATTDDAVPGAATSGLSFLGQRPRTNNLMVDGLDNNDRELGAALTSFSQEAIREFQVLTNSYSAEFGFATAGVVNTVTKRGTNHPSGSAFLFHRNEFLNAQNYFEKADVFGDRVNRGKAPFLQNQWGGVAGGPLKRDRTFFFASGERLAIDANNFVTIDPRAAAVLDAAGYPVQLGNVPYSVRATQLLGKIDHYWRPGHLTGVRASFSDVADENFGNERPGTSGRESFGGIQARSHGAEQLRKDGGVSANALDVLSSNWLTELSAQLTRGHQRTRSLDPTCTGPCDSEGEGGPEITVLGAAVVGRHQFEPSTRRTTRLQIKDTLSYAGRSHLVKIGGDFIYLDQHSTIPLVFGGAYVFGSLPAIPGLLPQPISGVEAVTLGLPLVYIQGYGDSTSALTSKDLGVFVQDDWQINRRVTLKAGVRYQRQFWPARPISVSDVGGKSFVYDFPQDKDNVAPRLAAAFDPRGDGRLSVHAAYGLFYGDQLTRLAASTIAHNGREGVRILLVPFPASVAAWFAPGRRLPEPATAYPSTTVSIGPGVQSPISRQASIGLTKALGDTASVSADVLWLRGSHLVGALNYNPLLPALGPGRRPNDINGQPGTSAEVFQYTDFGESWYKGLLLSMRRRFTRGLELRVSYTFSKAEDNSSVFLAHVEDSGAGRNPADPDGLPVGFDPNKEKGPAPNDRPHRLVVSGQYPLPRSIQLSAILTAQSGAPFTPLAGADLNGDGLPYADRARRNPLDPATSVGRDSQRMASQVTLDLRLSRKIPLHGRTSLEAIVDVFNLFNRTNFNEVNDVFGVGAYPGEAQRDQQGRVTYGRYSKALSSRQVQIALRLMF